jgi:predicted N-acetyltransferase YhbS
MGMRVAARPESPADWNRVEDLIQDVFGRAEEARFAARLRSVAGVLSLVAVVDDAIVGQLMFSPLRAGDRSPAFSACGLAPVAVARQWRGIFDRDQAFGESAW